MTKRFLIIIVLATLFFIVKLFYQAGQFKTITNHFEGKVINTYTSMPGPEDMQVDYESGNLFISATNRRPNVKTNSQDGIYRLKLSENTQPELIANDYTGGFHPHGISLKRVDSTLYVLVVNHNKQGEFIESFKYERGFLYHLASYSSALICCPNDVVAIAKNKFYTTNDHGTKKGFMRKLEDYLNIPRASIVYYNGTDFKKVADHFNYANGINISKDGSRLYMTATTGHSLHTFTISDDGSLNNDHILDLNSGLDNIDVDAAGNLWIASHPKLLSFIKHAKDSTSYSPSEVFKLIPNNDDTFNSKVVYMNDGQQISGSSIAVHYNNELLIGDVFDHKLLRTKLEK